MRLVGLALGLALVATAGLGASGESESAEATIVFLARHAEPHYPPNEKHPPDPVLNKAGRTRAQALAHTLEKAGIRHVYSTDLHRTLETAQPLAAALGVEIELYDHRALAELAEKLKSTPGRHFVSGHSNTTPELVVLLGGEPGEPIDVDREFDRLYVVTLEADGGVSTVELRYGARSKR